jgi:hypothetical protein
VAELGDVLEDVGDAEGADYFDLWGGCQSGKAYRRKDGVLRELGLLHVERYTSEGRGLLVGIENQMHEADRKKQLTKLS